MAQFKEMIIRKLKHHSMPQLALDGKWIDELGFTTGSMVSIVYHDSCLTLTTCPNAENSIAMLVVENKFVRGRERPQLVLNGFILKKSGLDVGDRVGLHLLPNQIQINKINR